jgi:hypothetical protein
MMKLIQAMVLSGFVLFGVATIHADSHHDDPRIIVGKDPCLGLGCNPIGRNFLVIVDQKTGGGIDDFENKTAKDIIELVFTAELPKNETVTCASNTFFGQCAPTLGKDNEWTITFSDPLNGGIPPGGEFLVGLNNAGENTGGWKGVKELNATATYAASPVAEPSTFLFLLAGLGSIWLRWRSVETKV